MFFRVMMLLCAAAGLFAETRAAQFQNRAAWVIDTPALRVTIMQSGAHVAEIVLKDTGAVNPLWIQRRATLDAGDYRRERDEKVYGGGAGARLMSGLLGHNLCFPFWGNPSVSEEKAGMTYHGETGVARWKQMAASPDSITIAAELPESKTAFVRTVRVSGQVAFFEETASNESGWDRPVGWCEHVTLGPPFLEKGATLMDASLTRGRANGDRSGKEIRWPAEVRTVARAGRSGFVDNFLVDPAREYGFFTAVHPGKRLLFGYLFRRKDFPWLNVWEENNPDMLTRGMEFSDTPVHGTLKALIAEPRLFDTPTFEWLDAKAKLTKRFCAFSVRVPETFRGVADVRREGKTLRIVETGSGATLTVPFNFEW